MSCSHQEVARAFARGEKECKGCNMFIEDGVVYSWGAWFPIAMYVGNGKVLWNIDGYSSSTAKHKCYVGRVLNGVEIIEATTDEIKSVINGNPIIIMRDKEPSTVSEVIRMIRTLALSKGVKHLRLSNIQHFLHKNIEKEEYLAESARKL